MPKLYVAVGIPGSGKSTYAAKLKKCNKALFIACMDSTREMLYGDESIQGDGAEVARYTKQQAIDALSDGKDVFYDATNTTRFARQEILMELGEYYSEAIAVYFDVSFFVCKKRNKQRNRNVPNEVMSRMSQKLSRPTKEEGFSKIFVIGVNGLC